MNLSVHTRNTSARIETKTSANVQNRVVVFGLAAHLSRSFLIICRTLCVTFNHSTHWSVIYDYFKIILANVCIASGAKQHGFVRYCCCRLRPSFISRCLCTSVRD